MERRRTQTGKLRKRKVCLMVCRGFRKESFYNRVQGENFQTCFVICLFKLLPQAVVHETEGLLGYIYCDFFYRQDKPHQVEYDLDTCMDVSVGSIVAWKHA